MENRIDLDPELADFDGKIIYSSSPNQKAFVAGDANACALAIRAIPGGPRIASANIANYGLVAHNSKFKINNAK
jgi:hypothetical protein